MDVLPESLADPSARDTVLGVPDGQKPTEAAELRIVLKRDDAAPGREGSTGWPGNPGIGWLRWLIPAAVWVRVTVPGAEAGRMLRMIERLTVAVTWPATVIGTLFGASAAHLPPTGTTIIVVLEIAVPPVMFRGRRSNNDE